MKRVEELTVAEALEEAGADAEKAQALLDAEKASAEPRKTLVDGLEKLTQTGVVYKRLENGQLVPE